MTTPTQTVIVRFDEYGNMDYFVNGESVRFLIVDERAPHDRVYEWTNRATDEEIREIIPDDAEIGSANDSRHDAVKARVETITDGKPRLSVVPKEPQK